MNKNSTKINQGTPHGSTSREIQPNRVNRAVMIFYLVGALMNGEHIHRNAELMEYGQLRDICVAVTRPIAYISNTTYLSTPRMWIEETLNPDARDYL